MGKPLTGGAQADILEGSLLIGDVDEASIQELLQDEERHNRNPQRIKITSRKVAIKVPRYYTYTKDDGQGVKVSRRPSGLRNVKTHSLLNMIVHFTRATGMEGS